MSSIVKNIRHNPNYRHLNHAISAVICLGSLALVQVIKGSIVALFPQYLALYFTVQFFGLTIQGSISDIYKRSLVLNYSLCLLIAILSFFVYSYQSQSSYVQIFNIIAIILLGLGGNANVVGRAEMIDIYYHKDRRRVLSWTVAAEAASWIFVGSLIRFIRLEPIYIIEISIVLSLVFLSLSLLFNTDKTEDKKHLHNVINEVSLIIKKNYKKLSVLTLIITLGQLGYFFFFYAQEEKLKGALLGDSYIAWFTGMFIGCIFLGVKLLKKITDEKCAIYGLAISAGSVILYIFGGMPEYQTFFLYDSVIFFVGGVGSGVYLPSFFSLISRGQSIHYQGILAGWVDSIAVFGDAFSNLMLLGLSLLPKIFTMLASVLLYSSSIFFLIYKKHKKL